MKLRVYREELLKPLLLVNGIVEKKQTLPILSNVLLKANNDGLTITATDLEIELINRISLQQPVIVSGQVTVPARKLVDIWRSLPEQAQIDLTVEEEKLTISSGRSNFTLTTLPADDYPAIDNSDGSLEFPIEQRNLRYLTERTHFAMAQQDVRYYLNGMLLEVKQGVIRSVATDGHRLALNSIPASEVNNTFGQVIVPRKGVLELLKLLEDSENEIKVTLNTNHIRLAGNSFVFTSKLIDGRFPDYERVLPKGGDKIVVLPRENFKLSLNRASILSNEKLKGIRLQLRKGLLRIIANNSEQEEAIEELSIDYNDEDLDIGFNVKYLTDILDTIDDELVKLTFSDGNSSILVEGTQEDGNDGNSLFVVMPMRL